MPTFAQTQAETIQHLEEILQPLADASDPQHQQQIEDALETARAMHNDLVATQRIDHRITRKPVTI